MKVTRRFQICLFAIIGSAGCVHKGAGFLDVANLINERAGEKVHWYQGSDEDEQVKKRVVEILSSPLNEEATIELALLNNRSLQATYEELGISQADLVQAGLLRNPSFSMGLKFPLEANNFLGDQFSIAQDFLSIFTIPMRKKVAAAEFERAKLRVAQEVLTLVSEVRSHFIELQAATQISAMRRTIVESTQISADISASQYTAGTLSELDFSNQQSMFEQSRLDLIRIDSEVLAAREKMNTLLGLWGLDTQWKIDGMLAEIPKEEPQREHVESLAISKRLDLEAARQEVLALEHALSLTRQFRFFTSLDVGVSTERDASGGIRVLEPTLSLELPIFDQKQATIFRLESLLQQSERRKEQLAIEIRAEVRLALNRVLMSRTVIDHYRMTLLPLREKILALSQERYNGMLIGVYQLIMAKQAEIGAYREYIEGVRDYWIARVNLERAIGGKIHSVGEDK